MALESHRAAECTQYPTLLGALHLLSYSYPRSAKAIVAKIALDQTVMSPIGAVLFFSYIKLMDGFQVFSIAPTLQVSLCAVTGLLHLAAVMMLCDST